MAKATLVALIGLAPLLAAAAPADKTTPSGLPVPRYVSLKFADVNARAAPGDDSRLLWVYKTKGLPVQVVAETEEWRRICGPDGGAAWVNRSEIDGRRTLLNQAPTATPIVNAPKAGAKVVALLNSQALARIRKCAPGWCQIRVGALQGWMATDQVWGVDEARQCK